jgi:hypothetical protein
LLAVSLACQDAVKPGPVEGNLARVSVTYLCENDFALHNQSTQPKTVQYRVLGTSEEGELLLPAATDTASTTLLTTLQQGPLRLSAGGDESDAVENESSACPPAEVNYPEGHVGEWSDPFPWPVVAVHLHLLPDGRVLSWGKLGPPQVYDPSSGTFTEAPSSTMLFCGGHTFLRDGSLLVSGGHLDDRRGLPDANLFDVTARTWKSLPPMSYARWYPTTTILPSGEVLSLAGTDEASLEVETPEVWDGSEWRPLPGARRKLPYYPRTFVAPNGLVFYAGELAQSAYLDPAGAGGWTPVATSHYGRRDYGSAVMYAPGKVMIVGGSDPPDGAPTNTAELIDLNAISPSWRYTGSMVHARRHLNATLLPDGQVLVTGGTSAAGFSELSGAIHVAEAWSPDSERWTRLAANQVSRVYHSSTILLPDGRLLHAGGGDGPGLPRELTAELFSPPYLFRGERPRLDAAPETVGYAHAFVLTTADAGKVVRITLVRVASVTHAFDQSQRFVELGFRRTAGGLTVEAPASNGVAPPGPYLLFLLNGAGVPSIARTILIH